MSTSSTGSDLPQRLRDTDATRRENILCELRDSSSPLTWMVSRILINDSDELVRIRAAEVLEEYAGDDDEYLVRSVLKNDPSPLVRASAASTLAKIGGEAARSDLVARLFSERDPTAKRYAASALASYRDRKLIPLFNYLLSEEQDSNIRTGLLYGLYRSGDASAVDELLSLLDHKDYLVRCQVLNSLRAGLDEADSKKVAKQLGDRNTREEHPVVRELITVLISDLTQEKT